MLPDKQICPEKTYLLKLANGLGWNISSDPSARPWVDLLAGIMSLPEKEDPRFASLLYRRKESPSPPEGWRECDLCEIRLLYREDSRDMVCELRQDPAGRVHLWTALFPVYRDVCFSGGLPLHGALVEKDGAGILLAGPADAGKTTCTRRLPASWKVLSDEESVIVRDEKGLYIAHPFPTWSRLSEESEVPQWKVESSVPLRAIFFIAKSSRDSAVRAGTGRAAMLIAGLAAEKYHIDWKCLDREERIRIRGRLFENAGSLALQIPSYLLDVSREGRFWDKMEEVLA